MPGGRPPGIPKTGGRRPGSPNKNQLTEDMRKSIVAVFKKMGGTKWLLDWAKENETEFVRLVLTRILPAPSRDDSPNLVINTGPQVNVDTLTDMQAASRIAFALAQAEHQMREIEVLPVEQPKPPPPVKVEPLPPYEPPSSFNENLTLQEQAERAAAHELVANTLDCDISSYHGGGAEQGVRRKKPGA